MTLFHNLVGRNLVGAVRSVLNAILQKEPSPGLLGRAVRVFDAEPDLTKLIVGLQAFVDEHSEFEAEAAAEMFLVWRENVGVNNG